MVLVDVYELTAINRKVICKHYASKERIIEILKHFMVFKNFIDCSNYSRWNNMFSVLSMADICHQLKAIHNDYAI